MIQDKTHWYSGKVRPVRPGVYQRLTYDFQTMYSHWNGTFWGVNEYTAFHAWLGKQRKSLYQRHDWRGLTKSVSNPDELKP